MITPEELKALSIKYGLLLEQTRKLKLAWTRQKCACDNNYRKCKNGNSIKMLFTFNEWLDIWVSSGHLDDRGCRKGQYVMSRTNDIGNYELGNVVIKTVHENALEGNIGTKRTEETRKNISQSKKGKPSWNKGKPNTWTEKISEEARKQISKSKIGRKRVYQDDGTYYMRKPI